jgi:hypothetical protein
MSNTYSCRHHGPWSSISDRQVGTVIGFVMHFTAYVLVCAGMVIANVVFWSGYFWAIWPVLGWGIGVLSHGLGVGRHLLPQVLGVPRTGRGGDVGRQPLHDGRRGHVTLTEDEWARTLRRIENLEAIVTTVEWDEQLNLEFAADSSSRYPSSRTES